MPNLRLHMYRVAGVASVICDNIAENVDRESIITACLLHDMGNIIKFKLDLFPTFLEPEGREYWQNVQNEYFKKYGKDEHVATIDIAREVGVNEKVMHLLESIGFTQAKENYAATDFDRKIAAYSDMRVEPHGVVSLEDRFRDGRKRTRIHKPNSHDESLFEEMSSFLRKIEKQIFEKAAIKTDDVTDEKISDYVKKLSDFEVNVHKS